MYINKINKLQQEKMNRKLIQKYLDIGNKIDSKVFIYRKYLRYLIDTIYDDTVFVCKCGNGLVFNKIFGDTEYGKCDDCGRKYHY